MKLNLKPVEKMISSLMVDECLVRMGPQRLGQGNWDTTTGDFVAPPEQILYYGPCMVTQQGSFPFTERSGGAEVTATYYTIRIPLEDPPPDIWDEDEVVIVDVHPEGEQALMGESFIVQGMDSATYSVCYNLRCLWRRPVPG